MKKNTVIIVIVLLIILLLGIGLIVLIIKSSLRERDNLPKSDENRISSTILPFIKPTIKPTIINLIEPSKNPLDTFPNAVSCGNRIENFSINYYKKPQKTEDIKIFDLEGSITYTVGTIQAGELLVNGKTLNLQGFEYGVSFAGGGNLTTRFANNPETKEKLLLTYLTYNEPYKPFGLTKEALYCINYFSDNSIHTFMNEFYMTENFGENFGDNSVNFIHTDGTIVLTGERSKYYLNRMFPTFEMTLHDPSKLKAIDTIGSTTIFFNNTSNRIVYITKEGIEAYLEIKTPDTDNISWLDSKSITGPFSNMNKSCQYNYQEVDAKSLTLTGKNEDGNEFFEKLGATDHTVFYWKSPIGKYIEYYQSSALDCEL